MFKDYLTAMYHYILPKRGLTLFANFMANLKITVIKNWLISDFIQRYEVNMNEALEENPKNYACYNEFFIRHLKPECRPLAKAAIVSPVDGFVSELGAIKDGQIIQAKGRYYTVEQLLASDAAESRQFGKGSFATLYLSPKDYHRIHMPIDAKLIKMIYVPGKFFSVQPATVRVIPHLFAGNERLVCFFETRLGPMVMVLVGATIVGAIGTRWQGDIKRSRQKRQIDLSSLSEAERQVRQGEEMGYFKLGSTVILLFAEGQQMQWAENLKAGSSLRFGQAMV